MKIVWDEPKRLANLDKHGLDFAEFERSFGFDAFKAYRTRPSGRGGTRYLVIGSWKRNFVVAAVVAPLGAEALSIVSLRHASQKERQAYERT